MGVLDDAIREHLDLKRRRGADPADIERAEREALGPVRREAPVSALSEGERPAALLSDDPELPRDDVEFGVEPVEPRGEDLTEIVPGPELEPDDAGPARIAAPDYDHPDLDHFTATEPEPIDDGLDPPTGAPLAAMPPEPEAKHMRRHLFGRHRHDHDEDGFGERTELPAELPDDDPFAETIAEEAEASAEPTAPRETSDGEAVGPAQPIPRDEPAPPAHSQPPALRITPDTELGHTVEYDVEEAFAEEDGADEDILEETPDFLADTPDHDRMWFEQKAPPDFDFDN